MTNHFPKRFLLAVLLIANPAWAAISSSMIFEVSTTGSNSNGGCFKEGATGTDFTINAGKYNFTDLAIDATTNTKVTSASHNFVAADVGNCMRTTAGTGFTTGVFEIVSVASNAATLDRSAGTTSSTGGTYFVGGPLLTLAQLNSDLCSGCRAYVHADGTYSMSAKVTFTYSSGGNTWIAGYTTTRGDAGQATLQASSIFGDYLIDANFGGAFGTFRNFILDVNSQGSSTRCLRLSRENSAIENIECKNASSPGAAVIVFDNHDQVGRGIYVHDSTYGGSVGVILNNNQGNVSCYGCVVRTISGNGAIAFYGISCYFCVVDSLSGTTTDGFHTGTAQFLRIDHCIVYSVTANGVNIDQSNSHAAITNCVFSTVLNGINSTGGTTYRAGDFFNDYNFTYNASGSATVNVTAGTHSATLTVDPFLAASSHDFRLNNTRNGGYAVRTGGTPNALPGITGTFYPDAGVAQHQDPKFRLFF